MMLDLQVIEVQRMASALMVAAQMEGALLAIVREKLCRCRVTILSKVRVSRMTWNKAR